MSKSFSDFKFEGKKTEEVKEKDDMQTKVKRSYDELRGLNQSELEQKLKEEVSRQKQENRFDYDLLSRTVESMRTFMSPETYENLKNLLERIK